MMVGLERMEMMGQIELLPAYPSHVAAMLKEGSIDLGLVPVAIIPEIAGARIIGAHCIASEGKVASVCLLSHVPIEEIQTVLLDYQSRTSAALIQILFEKYWKKEVEWQHTQEDFVSDINSTIAGLLIGDRCLEQRSHFKYVYDLGEAWMEMTGKPFVFAAWVANKALPASFVKAFNEANQIGLDDLDAVIEANQQLYYDASQYFKDNIHYNLDDYKRDGLNLFLKILTNKN